MRLPGTSLRLTPDVAIDFGTANLRVYVEGRGLALDTPNVAGVDKEGKILAVGSEAKELVGKTNNKVQTARAVEGGVIANYTLARKLLTRALKEVCGLRRLLQPSVLASLPSDASSVERRAGLQVMREAGAGISSSMSASLAAFIGTHESGSTSSGAIIADLGAGKCDVSLISMGGVVASRCARIGGEAMDFAIQRHIRTVYGIQIGLATAEELKVKLGSATPLATELRIEVHGRDSKRSIPTSTEVTSEEVRDVLGETLVGILAQVSSVIEATPPELAADILEGGLTLTGGLAQLKGIDTFLSQAIELPVRVAENAQLCCISGLGKALDNLEDLVESGAASTL